MAPERLATEAGVADRALRPGVERLHASGVPMVSSSKGGGGYWLATSADEVREFRERELRSRARVLLTTDQALLRVEWLIRDRERTGATLRQMGAGVAVAYQCGRPPGGRGGGVSRCGSG